jgi:asparagine synthetase B (glutamine-hydrolysing)
MCGIFCSVSAHGEVSPDESALANLKARGPDSCKEHLVELQTRSNTSDRIQTATIKFVSTVLALRGDQVQVQPLIDQETGSVLCWNGEAWKFGDHVVSGNDSVQVFELLLAASKAVQTRNEVLNVLTKIAGPFAFVYYDAVSSMLYFGRDRLGRRSLMISRNSNLSVFISSNSTNSACSSCSEIDTATIQALDLKNNITQPEIQRRQDSAPSINKLLTSAGPIPAQPSADTVNALQAHLRDALRLRVTDIPQLSGRLSNAKVAVLFSGGLDCSLLARLTHGLLPNDQPVDLLNVAFENPRSLKSANLPESSSPYEICPDRITGRSSCAELSRSCPERKWQFVAINIPYEESRKHRSKIVDLMHPHATEMDLSIAMALYFAARGQGFLSTGISYTTSARVLISGLGADELFAGYTRHATAFSRTGFAGLVNELELDYSRIGSRNLGRDDRVISYWGREARYPYLDETFVAFTLQLPVWEKCGFRPKESRSALEEKGTTHPMPTEDLEPAKLALRMLACKLNLPTIAAEKKRAIQFGARTAKMEVLASGHGRRKGTDIVV